MVGAQEEGACGGLGGDDPGRASLPSPSEFPPRALPLNPRDRARLPFPPPEAKSLPYLITNFSEGAKQPTQRDTRIQPRA